MKIRRATLNDLDEATMFAYERNVIGATRCRPFLVDDSYERIHKDYRDYIEKDECDILLQFEGEVLLGVTGIYWMEKDYYLSIFNVRIKPKLHKQASILAISKGVSLNQVVEETIEHELGAKSKLVGNEKAKAI